MWDYEVPRFKDNVEWSIITKAEYLVGLQEMKASGVWV